MPQPARTPVLDNVESLVEHTRALVDIDRARNHHADVRAGGLALLANGLLAVAATFGPRVGSAGALPVVYGTGLVLLLLAGISAALALRGSAGPAFGLSRVHGYVGSATQQMDPLELQRYLLTGWIAALNEERDSHKHKSAHLQRGYWCFIGGLAALVLVAVRLAEGVL
jgi:hypothetical protein